MQSDPLPIFPYFRDPVAAGSIRPSSETCKCCGRARGFVYEGNIYAPSRSKPEILCPWCIADGSAAIKFNASFWDAFFGDTEFNPVELPEKYHHEVFESTVGLATFNGVCWWVHCGEPAEYVERVEPYELIFECRRCGLRHIIPDYD